MLHCEAVAPRTATLSQVPPRYWRWCTCRASTGIEEPPWHECSRTHPKREQRGSVPGYRLPAWGRVVAAL